MYRYRCPDRRVRRRQGLACRAASWVASSKAALSRRSAAIERRATTHLVDDGETENPFDLIREIVTIVGWMVVTGALLLLAWAALTDSAP